MGSRRVHEVDTRATEDTPGQGRRKGKGRQDVTVTRKRLNKKCKECEAEERSIAGEEQGNEQYKQEHNNGNKVTKPDDIENKLGEQTGTGKYKDNLERSQSRHQKNNKTKERGRKSNTRTSLSQKATKNTNTTPKLRS